MWAKHMDVQAYLMRNVTSCPDRKMLHLLLILNCEAIIRKVYGMLHLRENVSWVQGTFDFPEHYWCTPLTPLVANGFFTKIDIIRMQSYGSLGMHLFKTFWNVFVKPLFIMDNSDQTTYSEAGGWGFFFLNKKNFCLWTCLKTEVWSFCKVHQSCPHSSTYQGLRPTPQGFDLSKRTKDWLCSRSKVVAVLGRLCMGETAETNKFFPSPILLFVEPGCIERSAMCLHLHLGKL